MTTVFESIRYVVCCDAKIREKPNRPIAVAAAPKKIYLTAASAAFFSPDLSGTKGKRLKEASSKAK